VTLIREYAEHKIQPKYPVALYTLGPISAFAFCCDGRWTAQLYDNFLQGVKLLYRYFGDFQCTNHVYALTLLQLIWVVFILRFVVEG